MRARLSVALHAVSVRRGKRVGAQEHIARTQGRRALGAHRLERIGEDAAPQTDCGGRVADTHRPREARLSRGRARHFSGPGEAADRLSRQRAAGQIRALWLESEPARAARHGLAPHGSAARAGRPGRAPENRRDALGVRAHGARRSTLCVAVLWTETDRAARPRALPIAGLALARRVLQRARRALPRAHRPDARRRARPGLIVDRGGAPRARCSPGYPRGDRARGGAASRGPAAETRRAR